MKALWHDSNGTLTSKLPENARFKWNRKFLPFQQRRVKDPELAAFIDFINDEFFLVTYQIFP